MAYICTGKLVYDVADPRHVGRVRSYAVTLGQEGSAVVVWQDTGHVSELPLRSLREEGTDYPLWTARRR